MPLEILSYENRTASLDATTGTLSGLVRSMALGGIAATWVLLVEAGAIAHTWQKLLGILTLIFMVLALGCDFAQYFFKTLQGYSDLRKVKQASKDTGKDMEEVAKSTSSSMKWLKPARVFFWIKMAPMVLGMLCVLTLAGWILFTR
jgi:hypothetical protein